MQQGVVRVAEGFHARQMVATGQGQVAPKTVRPGFADEAVLALELAAFVAADGRDQGQVTTQPAQPVHSPVVMTSAYSSFH